MEQLIKHERLNRENMITKTDFIKHEKCPLLLWLYKSRPDLLPEVTPELLRIFAMGNAVDSLARELYPEGIEIEDRFEKGFIETKSMIKKGATVLFQPSAVTLDGLAATADILTLDATTGLWDLREVKSSAHVKEEHLIDVAFQRVCFERAGIKIGKTFVINVNNKYVKEGEIEPEKLFKENDVTEKVGAHIDMVRKQIEEAKKVISGKAAPDLLLIQKCHNPEQCDHLPHYIHGFPEIYSMAENLPEGHLKALLTRGILDYSKLPQQLLDKVGFVAPVPFTNINPEGIRNELEKLTYPLYFFDYETYGPTIPAFDGTRPFQQIPFQYSVHIQRESGGAVEHREFLAETFGNPMPELLARLKQDIGPEGNVIVWNEAFEKGKNKEMAEKYPEESAFLTDLNSRMFDLMKLFKFKRELYQHSEFNGSYSLKVVLPVLCPHLSYSDLEIKDGNAAAESWPILTGGQIDEVQRDELREAMLQYCGRDTEAMVEILKHLEGKI